MEVKPICAPIARSNAPAATGMSRAIAAIAVSAWPSRIERHVLAVRNVSGIHSENTTNSTAKM